jgi:hypothetical protein
LKLLLIVLLVRAVDTQKRDEHTALPLGSLQTDQLYRNAPRLGLFDAAQQGNRMNAIVVNPPK